VQEIAPDKLGRVFLVVGFLKKKKPSHTDVVRRLFPARFCGGCEYLRQNLDPPLVHQDILQCHISQDVLWHDGSVYMLFPQRRLGSFSPLQAGRIQLEQTWHHGSLCE
jgi:hypothetical protein